MEILVFNYLWEAIINFSETFLFFLFVNAKLYPRKGISSLHIKQLSFLLIQSSLICYFNFLHIPSFFTIIFSMLLNIVFTIIFYESSYIIRIFWGSAYSVICLVAEYITFLIPQTLSNTSSLELLAGGKLRVPMSLLYLALIAVFIFVLVNIKNKDILLTPFQKIAYLIISVLGISIAHYILLVTLTASQYDATCKLENHLIIINLSFLILFLALLLYIYQLGQSKEQNIRLVEQSKQYALEEQQYENLLKTTETLREIKHDIEIHLDIIQTLSENGEYEKLNTYVGTYHRYLDQAHHLLSTGNTAIDCILSNKLLTTKQLGIQMDYSVLIPSPLPFDDITLSSLLGNLFDNALEACQRLFTADSQASPWISFYIKPYQHMVLIHIENSCDGIYKNINDKFFVSLKMEAGHGYGLKRIQSIVYSADGIIDVTPKSDKFIVHIMIPLREEQSIAN